jgi:hypothetical protein
LESEKKVRKTFKKRKKESSRDKKVNNFKVLSKVLIGIIVALGLFSSVLWKQNSNLSALNQAFELRDAEQKLAIESLQSDFALQTEGLLEIQARNQKIQQEMSRYLDIFKRHDLTRLAAAKPGLIEPRINKGTKDVFDSIEEDSRNIDSLDDGLQLQSDTK